MNRAQSSCGDWDVVTGDDYTEPAMRDRTSSSSFSTASQSVCPSQIPIGPHPNMHRIEPLGDSDASIEGTMSPTRQFQGVAQLCTDRILQNAIPSNASIDSIFYTEGDVIHLSPQKKPSTNVGKRQNSFNMTEGSLTPATPETPGQPFKFSTPPRYSDSGAEAPQRPPLVPKISTTAVKCRSPVGPTHSAEPASPSSRFLELIGRLTPRNAIAKATECSNSGWLSGGVGGILQWTHPSHTVSICIGSLLLFHTIQSLATSMATPTAHQATPAQPPVTSSLSFLSNLMIVTMIIGGVEKGLNALSSDRSVSPMLTAVTVRGKVERLLDKKRASLVDAIADGIQYVVGTLLGRTSTSGTPDPFSCISRGVAMIGLFDLCVCRTPAPRSSVSDVMLFWASFAMLQVPFHHFLDEFLLKTHHTLLKSLDTSLAAVLPTGECITTLVVSSKDSGRLKPIIPGTVLWLVMMVVFLVLGR